LNRRRFLKYAGATAAVVGASVLGLNYASRKEILSNRTVTTQSTTTTSSKLELPPFAKFQSRPQFIIPTDEQAIQFINLSWDADGDPLTYEWLIDNRPVGTQKDFSTKLPVGLHLVQLNVSNGTRKSTATNIVTVEPDQIYPISDLMIPLKGICYSPGFTLTGTPRLSEEQIDEEMDTISNELRCNAVRIFSNWDDSLLKCGQIALRKPFTCIALAPRYIDSTVDETAQKLAEFAKKAQALREISNNVQLWIGNELTIDARGIRKGATYNERAAAKDPPNLEGVLNDSLRDLVSAAKRSFSGRISYSAGFWEPVDWGQLDVDIIGSNEYFWPKRDSIYEKIAALKSFGKPVYITEFGSSTFKSACQWGGGGFFHYNGEPYDEDAQASCIQNYLKIFDPTRPDGCFLWEYKENDAQFMGIVTPPETGTSKRKKGFYMYKSYQRTS